MFYTTLPGKKFDLLNITTVFKQDKILRVQSNIPHTRTLLEKILGEK
jgi:hypothetical protein